MTEPAKQENQLESIPKVEFEKLKTDSDGTIAGLKQALEDAKLQLLTPEYLDFVEKKRVKKEEPSHKGNENEDIKNLRSELATLRAHLQDQAAYIELEGVRRKYKDFDTFKDDVQKVLEESKTDITIDQAYLIAKGRKEPEGKKEEKTALQPSSERPSGIYPPTADSQKKFKNSYEAANDAATQVLAKHGISGDTI